MAITKQDKQLVRMILRQTLFSAFPNDPGVLTVSDVACRVWDQWNGGRVDMLKTDNFRNAALVQDRTPLTLPISPESIQVDTRQHDGMSWLYWDTFHGEAVAMLKLRGGR